MDELRSLLDRFWIRRAEDRELYYSVKKRFQSDSDFQRFLTDTLGWNVFISEEVIKLEKVPPRSLPWMGIAQFTDSLDYCLLCAVFLYLADLDDGAQFLLSSLTEAVESFLSEIRPVRWTSFSDRTALVRVLRFVQDAGILIVYDGKSEDFQRDQAQEVLYENTGLSRCFPVHYSRDILSCQSAEDFEALMDDGLDPVRQRSRHVWRQLVLSPALYRNQFPVSDFDYVKNQRPAMGRRLENLLDGELYVNADGAYCILDESNPFGETFPGPSGRRVEYDAVLALCGHLRERIEREFYFPREDGTILLTWREFLRELEICRSRWEVGWSKGLRELSTEKLAGRLAAVMSAWMLMEEREDGLALLPASGKWIGRYDAQWEASRNPEPAEGGETAETPQERDDAGQQF